ncbi:TetM/TetW/TetO/TetS family tetracycline resistance ribosomal protection protein [Gracilibacillus oryzae]|uniref:TetM/TetW/TetO/TetS family tetracycline resistance ribosomal protection protein n=1 Tax=Gracilibacillus oryzae TaxID=1672701 RepID=A0A7C8KU20_9BACI|nr:TetM/TetW/TetO/TetS family tetracycline resistance ribosomal protection protein [Gracilibacillus oryzae]KAB8138922.1 TetM/TetW/TetO/TetS family tetracycline resistance ribosomal protection protein [Gracilibacillus oryzae]
MTSTVGLFAHVDAGKTTFAEQLLFLTNRIDQPGRVDHQNTYLDHHPVERDRGITVFSEQALLQTRKRMYQLIDTPGHVDFSAEMERMIHVIDYGIIIISAVEGIQGHTETVWQLMKKQGKPVFFFINKLDREGANKENVIKEIEKDFTSSILDAMEFFQTDYLTEKTMEKIAEHDDLLLEHYLDGNMDEQLWKTKMAEMIQTGTIFPYFYGSALQNVGIDAVLQALDTWTNTAWNDSDPFTGTVYKIRHDKNSRRLTFLKAIQGQLAVRDQLNGEKINELRVYDGDKFQVVDKVAAGQLFAVVGNSSLSIGDTAGNGAKSPSYSMIPTMRVKAEYAENENDREILQLFELLDAEDPSLKVEWNSELKEIHFHILGVIQLEVLKQIITERFNKSVEFTPPEILYKETINHTVTGYGHFEPLRHYAEVHLQLEPGRRGTGITFENRCHVDDLPLNYQRLVQQHIFERTHTGILTGSPLTDIHISLINGRAHEKHTSGGDFREAAYRALRQGLEQAEKKLLEPFYEVKIKVESHLVGRVMADIEKANGRLEIPVTEGETALITGKVPVSTFRDYPVTFASFTKGKGSLQMRYAGYDECHNPDEVAERIAYEKNRDPIYRSSSVFCSKGESYSVPWQEAKEHMHANTEMKTESQSFK